MTALYDASSAANWQKIHTSSYQVTYQAGKHVPIYIPIPIQELSVNTTAKLLAIYCTSSDYPSQIKYLGRVIQSVVSDGTLPTSIATGDSVSIYSNRTVLADFTKFDDVYRLLIAPKYYVENLTIHVYEYVGSAYYQVESRLDVIEGKIDQLL